MKTTPADLPRKELEPALPKTPHLEKLLANAERVALAAGDRFVRLAHVHIALRASVDRAYLEAHARIDWLENYIAAAPPAERSEPEVKWRRPRRHNAEKKPWHLADFSKSNAEVAEIVGCTPQSVIDKRRRLGIYTKGGVARVGG